MIDNWNVHSEEVNQMSRIGLDILMELPMRMQVTYNGIKSGVIRIYVENLDPKARKHCKNGES